MACFVLGSTGRTASGFGLPYSEIMRKSVFQPMSLVPSSFAGQCGVCRGLTPLSRRSPLFLRWSCAGWYWSLEAAYALGLYCALGAAFSIFFLVQFRIGQNHPAVSVAAGCHADPQVSALAAAFCSVTAFSVGRLD